MSGLHPMASIETRAPSRSRRSTSAGIAVISLDFSSIASWPSTSRSVVANADTKCRAFCARDAVVKFAEQSQERQMSLTPIDNVVIVIAARDRAAYHQKQHLA